MKQIAIQDSFKRKILKKLKTLTLVYEKTLPLKLKSVWVS